MWTDWILAGLTLVIAIFTVLVFLTYERIEWLTGAMETHSDLLMKLEAQRQNVELVWWDLSIEPLPSTAKHGEPVDLKRIYCGLPFRLRDNKSTFGKRMGGLLSRLKYGPTT